MVLIPDAFDARTSLPRPLRVLMVTAELAPFARSGGLGDVMQGLCSALGALGVEVVVVTPVYGVSSLDGVLLRSPWPRPIWTPIGGDMREVGVLETSAMGDVRIVLLDCPPLFRRGGIYGDEAGDYPDNDLRFGVLSAAALQVSEVIWGGPPDVLHAHDWHAALSVAYARLSDNDAWRRAASVLTVHNLAYQGRFPLSRASVLGLPESCLHEDAVRQGDNVNLLKAGITYADRVTTVSRNYARDVMLPESGGGLDQALRARSNRLIGITNGIDTRVWDPARDRALPARYDAHDPSGRGACKIALAAELGLDCGRGQPLVGMVTRLTHQKGVDMLTDVLPELVAEGLRFAIVAKGDGDLERRLQEAAATWPTQVAYRPVFGDPIARRIYAGADIFLMPSRFEPCGLGQQYAMRYGAVPVATRVGGLADTIEQVDENAGTGTGFLFDEVGPEGIKEALLRAVAAYTGKLWPRLVRNCMLRNASWDASARLYFAMYRELTGAPPRPSFPAPRSVAAEDEAASVQLPEDS